MTLFHGFRLAVRRLWHMPTLSSIVVLTVTVGVATTATLFSAIDGLVLRRLPVNEPDRLVLMALAERGGVTQNIPLATTEAIGKNLKSLESVCAYTTGGIFAAEIGGVLQQTALDAVGRNCFQMFGTRAELGRLIEKKSAESGTEHVAVLGYGLWKRAFGGTSDAVGQTVSVGGIPLRVIGVAPRDYSGLNIDVAPDMVVPLEIVPELIGGTPNPRRPIRSTYALGKLLKGANINLARAELASSWPFIRATTVPDGYSPEEKDVYTKAGLEVTAAATGVSLLRTRYERPLWLLLGLAAVLLATATVNATGLLLVRAQARARETAICLALGSGRLRVVILAAAEGLILCLVGAFLAVPLVWLATRTLGRVVWTGVVPMTLSLTPHSQTLIASVSVTAGLALIVGAVPAALTLRQTPDLRNRGTTRRQNLLSKSMVVAQVAFCLVMIFSAALFVRSLHNLQSLNLGVKTTDVFVGRLATRPGMSPQFDRSSYSRALLDAVEASESGSSAALVHLFPAPLINAQRISIAGTAGAPAVTTAVEQVSPGFFKTLMVPILQGRDFTWNDARSSEPVAIITKDLAISLFGTNDVLGRLVRVGDKAADPVAAIIAVVDNLLLGDRRKLTTAAVFRPLLQETAYQAVPVLLIHTTPRSSDVARRARAAVASQGREFLPNLAPLHDVLDQSILQDRLLAAFAVVFAAFTSLLGFLGLFALVNQTVVMRTREIGIRMAVGATPRQVAQTVLAQAALLSAVGIVIGVPLTSMIGQVAGSLVFAPSGDAIVIVIAAAIILLIGILGGWSPANRAARVDPLVSLRVE